MKDNVGVRLAEGDACFVCDGPTTKGEPVVCVAFDVPAYITTFKVNRDMHVGCASELLALLDLRIKQAQNYGRV